MKPKTVKARNLLRKELEELQPLFEKDPEQSKRKTRLAIQKARLLERVIMSLETLEDFHK